LDVDGIVTTVVEPDAPNGCVLFCLPGGGMSRRYFDLANGFSMAEHLAARGYTVLALHHPGVRDSPPPDDPWALTPAHVAHPAPRSSSWPRCASAAARCPSARPTRLRSCSVACRSATTRWRRSRTVAPTCSRCAVRRRC